MPEPKTCHPSSFAYATIAVAEDLERIAETLRSCPVELYEVWDAVARLDHQAAALREIAAKLYREESRYLGQMFDARTVARILAEAAWPKYLAVVPLDPTSAKSCRDQWPTHVEVEAEPSLDRRLAELASAEPDEDGPDIVHGADYPGFDPDAEGPSFDDPVDEPRRR